MIGMAEYPDKYFELAIVDPPYGIENDKQVRFGNKKDNKKWDKNIPDNKYFIELFRISKNQIIWGGNYFNLKPTRCFLIWDKMNGSNDMADCEFGWTSFKTSARIFKHHIFTGIGNFNYHSIHPTQKPINLYKWLLKNYAKPGDKILDTHVGSASSLIACIDMGFDYVGFELDPDYYQAACERIKKHTDQIKMF